MNILRRLVIIWLTCTLSVCVSGRSQSAHGHAWRGQAVVLFVTYEVRDDRVGFTLGLPAPLLLSSLTALKSLKGSTQSSHRGLTQRNLMALYEAPGGPELLIRGLRRLIERDLKIKVDRQRFADLKLDRVDLIMSERRGGAIKLDDNTRLVTSIEGVEVELHRGAPSALVIKASAPLKSAPRELSFRWESERWFVKRGRRGRRRAQLNTREVSGIIIDREGITPLSFTPTEPEVIWRSPHALKAPTTQMRGERNRHEAADLSDDSTRSPSAHFEALHRSIYEAFSHERDEEIYDALSVALSGSALDEVFSSVYQALIMRDEGGARAQVTHVIKLDVKQLQLDDSLARAAQLQRLLRAVKRPYHIFHYRWRVAGEVSHWGHTHRRVHDYEALYVMTQTSLGWRITHSAPLRQTRRPELEGGL